MCLQEVLGVEVAADVLNDLGADLESPRRIVIHEEIEVARAIARLHLS